jgi:hypothetical protein
MRISRPAGLVAAVLLGVVAGGVGAPAGAVGADPPAPVADQRFYDAAVNLSGEEAGSGGYAGAVAFHSVLGGGASVQVWLSRSSEVTCDDGTTDVASTVLRTVSEEATEPGPVVLTPDRRLRSAEGRAVVDLLLSESPGCGAAERSWPVPAREVTVSVTGTSVRYFSGYGFTAATRSDRGGPLSYRLARDGTGRASVAGFLEAAESEHAFLVYGVDRWRAHGAVPEAPGNVAPPGGTGADGFWAVEHDPPQGVGLLYEDAWVTAATAAPSDGRATTIAASRARMTGVRCPDGTTAIEWEVVDGYGDGTLVTGPRLDDAAARAAVKAERWTGGGCTDPDGAVRSVPAQASLLVDAVLTLTATAPTVRVKGTYWQIAPGDAEPVRTHVWYDSRPAAGGVSVGDAGGAVEDGTISRSGPLH